MQGSQWCAPSTSYLSLIWKCHMSYLLHWLAWCIQPVSTKLELRHGLCGLRLHCSLVDPDCMPQASQWSRTCGIFIGDRKERERDDWWMGNIGECSVSFVSNLRYIYDISSLLLLNWEGMQMKTHTAGATRSDMEVLFISLYKFLKHFLPLPAVVVVWPIGQWNSHKMYKQILASDLIGIRMVTKGGCVNIDTWGNKKIQKKPNTRWMDRT